MKKSFKFYLSIWVVLLLIFNIIVFVTPNSIGDMNKFEGAFWPGYIFIIVAFIGQLICAWYALNCDEKKIFYRLPMVSISYTSLIAMVIVGTLCMVIPNLPIWISIIVCVITLAVSFITLMQAQAAETIVTDIDTKVKSKTLFIKALTVEAESLISRASTEKIRRAVKKVSDAVRYSDPMSSEALTGIESQITLKFSELTQKVAENNEGAVETVANEIVILLNDRNKKCMLLK